MTDSAIPKGALGHWWAQGARTAFLLRPRWGGLHLSPWVLALLLVVPWAASVLLERLFIEGPARFFWQALTYGWMGTLLSVWCCWFLSAAGQAEDPEAPSPAALFGMLSAQALPLTVMVSLLFLPMLQLGMFQPGSPGLVIGQVTWCFVMAWMFGAPALVLWRSGTRRVMPRVGALTVLLFVMLLSHWLVPNRHWYPAPAPAGDSADEKEEPAWLTQEVMEQQTSLMEHTLQSLAPQRPGVVDLYVLTFAPYASQDVFRHESGVVATVMGERFNAKERTVQLVNHVQTRTQLPWATPLNLQRAIRQVARVMDRKEDVLFIHLTSHGARDGKLSAAFWPMEVEPMTPQKLKAWLDEAGVRYRVVSVSACYSGSWIEPLSDDGTLVMTAADAEHTSYGCGSRSELTYFGRAMYDEQMRSSFSFEKAHAAAREVIEKREKEAGKADGYSNPQIFVGARVRERLKALEEQLKQAAMR